MHPLMAMAFNERIDSRPSDFVARPNHERLETSAVSMRIGPSPETKSGAMTGANAIASPSLGDVEILVSLIELFLEAETFGLSSNANGHR